MTEASPAPSEKTDSADITSELTQEEQQRQPTLKALMNDIDKAQKALHQSWKRASEDVEVLKAAHDDATTLRCNLPDTQAALQSYREAWSRLEQLYEKDKTGEMNEERMKTKLVVLENIDEANNTITQFSERVYQLSLEIKSTSTHWSARSRRSSNLSTSSHQSIKVQAIAAAAAAARNAQFEEVIAKRTADHKIKQARREIEERTEQATVEAELRILKAQQLAAVEQSRAEAILQVEQENGACLTSPHHSSNDHALQFLNEQSALTSKLLPAAPVFHPASSIPRSNSPFPPDKHTPVNSPSQNASSPIQTKPSQENSLLAVTREITNTLAHQRQPTQEPDVYGGDPIMFQPWRSSFETMVNQAPTPATQKLAFLAKYTRGEVRKLVDRFRHRYISSPDTAYKEAWRELEKRFGNKTKITTEIIRKLMDFPRFKAGENKKLRELADLCADVAAQMEDLPDLSVLNYSHNLHPLLDKLPQHIHNTWRKLGSQHKKEFDRYPPFTVLAEFLAEKATMHNDPELYPPNQTLPTTTERSVKNRNPALSVMATSSPSARRQDPQQCLYHDQKGHHISDCISFSRKPIQERRDFCKERGLCFKCGNRHRIRDCTTAVQCKKCKDTGHASFMHTMRRQDGQEVNPEKPKDKASLPYSPPTSDANTKCTRFLSCPLARSCSKIVLCRIYHQERPERSITGYVILDDQSNACLASPEIFDTLDLTGPTYPYELSTCNGSRVITEGRRASGLIVESLDRKKEKLPTVVENSHIPGDKNEVPRPEFCSKFPHLKSLADKIPELKEDVEIILLIGRNCPEPLKVRESRNGPRGTPWAQRTDLGWTVSGQVCMAGAKGRPHVSVSRTSLQQLPADSDFCENHIHVTEFPSMLHRSGTTNNLYKETSEDGTRALSVEDQRFIDIMTKGAQINSEGNLEFPLPFKSEQITLPNNRSQARSRLNNLMRTLRKKPEMMKRYIAFFEKILMRNHASPVPKEELTPSNGAVWYLPHFAVQNPRKPDIRVVFDASAEFAGTSLNKILLQGPDHMNSLLGILLRFRLNKVAVMGDVEQMFHNFHVNPKHRDFLRFLWFENNNPEEPTAEYRMNVHLFGIINVSSPAVATFGLRMIANECTLSQGEDVTEFIHRDFYVDDGLTSVPDSHTALSLIKRTRQALSTTNLRFHKIASNDTGVMNALPEEARAKNLQNLDLDNDELPTQRSLGVYWSLGDDCFTFKVNLQDKPFSRRGVLSIASSIFDPLGFIAPVTIEGKIILREINTEIKKETSASSHDTLDKPLPKDCLPKWLRWRNSLHQLEDIQIQRCYQPPDFGPVRRRELHVFSDASMRAIGAVAYLRLVNEDGEPYVSFLIAKAKVTPSHAVSVPRLELCAAVLATTLVQTATPELRESIAIDDITYYTDSKVVIGYIANESKRFHVYVANRVHSIHKVSQPSQWHHVSTDENPADIASRSVPANQLKGTRWFRGPKFLWRRDTTPKKAIEIIASEQPQLGEDDPDVKKQTNILATSIADEQQGVPANANKQGLTCERFLRFSTWLSLRKAIATLVAKARTYKAKHSKDTRPNQFDSQNLPAHARASLDDLQHAEG